jgi:hypothetical protein
MKRREFIEKVGVGSALVGLPAIGDLAPGHDAGTVEAQEVAHAQGHGGDDGLKGPLASATVSFGAWDTATAVDRFPNQSPRLQNAHFLIPNEVTIKQGGSVNFVISGFHHVLVYRGLKPSDINISLTIPPTLGGPPLIDDPVGRVYRGLDPSVLPPLPGSATPPPLPVLQDRVEVVRFPTRGNYLVLCGVLPHFFDAATGQFVMFGYVRVIR